MNWLTSTVTRLRKMFWGDTYRTSARWGGSWLWRGYGHDFGKVDPVRSSLVMAPIHWICRTFPEAPLQLTRLDEKSGKVVPIGSHRLLDLMERPNPYYSGILLWMATLIDILIKGNAYWVKIRDGAGRVVQLWWVPERMMEPVWGAGPEFIDYYEYTPNGSTIRVPVENVVHFRWGIDPDCVRKGLSPLASLLKEIFTDEQGAQFSAATLRNMGVPGIIIQPEDTMIELTPENANLIRQDFKDKFGGDNRGEPMVLSDKVKVTTLTVSPKDMDVAALRLIPESRISAVLGVPAVVSGLYVGLKETASYNNYSEAREAAFEGCIIPLQRLLAADLSLQLLRDFPDDVGVQVGFNLSGVRVLQEDQNKLAQRLSILVRAGILTVNEARLAMGYPEQSTPQAA